MNLPPIPQSQKNRVRLNALNALRLNVGDAFAAKSMARRQNEREVGGAWVNDANELSDDLIDYWEKNGICDPAAVFVAGEPGMQDWDE